ncbi:MAG TPA: M42 family metallopeptidase [Solirubrobacteraceae bacterium]|nr:M42 family metallopeptidase [Solirubrobacteraceae bacterium]
MAIPVVLRELLEAAGPSGYETAPAHVWRKAAEAAGLEVAGDVVGSCTARIAGNAGGPRLAVVGHIDEIGLIVHHIDDDGFLWFKPVGGWDAQILVGQRVTLLTREGPLVGVIGKKPIHLLRDDEGKKVPEIRDLHIDIAAKDGDDARTRVRAGDVAVIAAPPVELPNDRLCSRALDNRLGAYVALEAARLVAQDGGAPGDVVAVAATQEEITFAGSRTSAYAIEPAVALAVDVTHATDAPGIEVKESGRHPLGSGPALNRGSIIHPAVFELLHATAEEESIAFTVEVSSRGTGTDADAIHLTRAGIPTGVVSVPLRYMHSPVEMVQLDDVTACARLIAAFARRLTAETSFAR